MVFFLITCGRNAYASTLATKKIRGSSEMKQEGFFALSAVAVLVPALIASQSARRQLHHVAQLRQHGRS